VRGTWGPEGYVEEGSGDESLSIGAPLENLKGGGGSLKYGGL
jgi:hypothetical protein